MPLEETNTSISKCERAVRTRMAEKLAPTNELSFVQQEVLEVVIHTAAWTVDHREDKTICRGSMSSNITPSKPSKPSEPAKFISLLKSPVFQRLNC